MPQSEQRLSRGVWLVAVGIALLHMLTNSRYGFHRDELQFLDDAKHLDWGFVAYPPLTAFVERVSSAVFGLSLTGLRLASVLAQMGLVVLAGEMARLLGGNRKAQVLAAFATGFGTLALFEGTEFQYGTFDLLWCALLGYALVRILVEDNARFWLLAGLAVGLGVETKYTMVFVAAGAVLGFALTPARKLLANKWFVAGLAITLLLALPNYVWQVRHDFISFHFMEHIHKRDVRLGRGKDFWIDQFYIATLSAAAPVWLAGLWRAVRDPRWRPLAIFWAAPVVFFGATHARGYYTAGVYPVLLALGAPVVTDWLARQIRALRVGLSSLLWVLLAANAALMCAILVPLASSGPLREFALSKNDDLRAEFGWPEIVARVAIVRNTLPMGPGDRLGIVTGNYGAQGAIDAYGPQYGLPEAISLTNSAWLRSYPKVLPTKLIVLGYEPEWTEKLFAGCKVVASTLGKDGVRGEEYRERPYLYVCQGPRLPWPEFWQEAQSFG